VTLFEPAPGDRRVQQPCLVPGCDGTMTFDDSHMPAYGTWVCDRERSHNELLPVEWRPPPKTKPCTVGGCTGQMRFSQPHLACWTCNLADHEEWEWGFVWRPSRAERRTDHRGRALLRHKPRPPVLYLELPCYGCGGTFTVDTVDGRIDADWSVWRCPSCGHGGPTRADAEAFLSAIYENYAGAPDEEPQVSLHTPFRIDRGLYFEQEALLIPWDTLLDPSTVPGQPDIRRNESGRRFQWKNRRVLGLAGDALVIDSTEATAQFARELTSGYGSSLTHFMLTTPVAAPDGTLLPERRPNAEAVGQLKAFMRRIHDHFARSFGPASGSLAACCLGLPLVYWRIALPQRTVYLSCHPAGELEVFVDVALDPVLCSPEEMLPFVAWDFEDPRIPQGIRAAHRRFAAYELDRRERWWSRRPLE
jgi:hypothetical protein